MKPCALLKCQKLLYLAAATLLLQTGCSTQNYQQVLDEQKEKPLTVFAQEITCPSLNLTLGAGETKSLPIMVKNVGTEMWHSGSKPLDVDLGYRWRDEKGAILPIEGNRAIPSKSQVEPGKSASAELKITAPPKTGTYTLVITMVQEKVAWFVDKGAAPLTMPVRVE